MIVSGRPVDLPAEVEGVTISVRTSPARGRGFAGKVVEAVRDIHVPGEGTLTLDRGARGCR